MEHDEIDTGKQRCVTWEETYIRDRMISNRERIESLKCCIYKIPDNLRKVNEAAYTPQVVSIGPLHYNNPALQTMEMHKTIYLESFLGRTQKTLHDFIVYIADCEDKIRGCYEQIDGFFHPMFLLDGIFIIEYIIMTTGNTVGFKGLSDAKLYQPLNIESDLILLENQLPFFLLEGLYNVAFPSKDYNIRSPSNSIDPFLKLACAYFSRCSLLSLGTARDSDNVNINPGSQIEHFTDLLRHLCPCPTHVFPLNKLIHEFFPLTPWSKSATVLYEAGVKFKMAKQKRSLCDIRFKNGVLIIPRFTFQSSTESYIRNLMAWELLHYPNDPYICQYFFFMDNLINTAKDVDLLVGSGIIRNWLGDSEAMANLVNSLPRNVLITSLGNYALLCLFLNNHCDVGWHRWKASFKRDYLGTPWKIASTSAAIILLVLTLIQTVCSIISLVKGK